jgi:PST family polysaccharide transporter
MRKNLVSLLRHGFIFNIASLYGVQFAKYLLPLITIPYLTRVLGASGWGLLALTQGYAAYLGFPIDYGFNFSATREVARTKADRTRASSIFAGVLGAKCALAFACVLISYGVVRWVPVFRGHRLLFWMGVTATVVTSFTPIWYFIGLERLKLVATLDIIGRGLGIVGIFLFVRGSGDAWRVLAIQAVAGSTVMITAMGLAYGELIPRFPSWREVWQALRDGRSMFIMRAAQGLYTSGNAFILGLFAPPEIVGYYAGAEKLVRAALQLFQPPYQALFPKMSGLVNRIPGKSARLARIGVILFGGSGLVGGGLIFICAPWLVRITLGAGYGAAVPITRLLAVLLPLIGVNIAMGGLWMIPHRMDTTIERITLGAGAINVGLAAALAGLYQGIGVAVAVVIAESFVAAAMVIHLRRSRFRLWGVSTRTASGN